MKRIAYTKPSITNLEVQYATDAAKNGWGERCYDYINKFEDLFRKHLEVKYAIATSSCTGALHMGMYALGIGPGDEVILADTNWIATVAPVVHLGAKPVFVDILPDTWCIDPEKVEGAITRKTKAIIAVHLYGNLCDMDKLMAIANKYGIAVIEDAAEAIGSVYKGKKAGSIGKFGAFSFHGTKTITTGEGGAFVTNDEKLFERVLTLSNHGRCASQKKQFWPDLVGFKYKMSNIQAAIGCAQLERINELVRRKREIFNSYATRLTQLQQITMNPEAGDVVNGFWMPTVVFDESNTNVMKSIRQEMAAQNIDARVFFWPLSSLDMFENRLENVISYTIPERAINLPSFHEMTSLEIDRVCNVFEKILNAYTN